LKANRIGRHLGGLFYFQVLGATGCHGEINRQRPSISKIDAKVCRLAVSTRAKGISTPGFRSWNIVRSLTTKELIEITEKLFQL
jgi:hypothetical protein